MIAAAKTALREFVASHPEAHSVRTPPSGERRGKSTLESPAPDSGFVLASRALSDLTRLRLFCARFGITPQTLCPHAETDGERIVHPGTPSGPDWVDEEVQRANAILPGSEMGWEGPQGRAPVTSGGARLPRCGDSLRER